VIWWTRWKLGRPPTEEAWNNVPKDFKMKADTGHFQLSGQNVTLIFSVTALATKKNWPMLAIYFVVTLGGIVVSYFTNGWISVRLSAVVAVITFGVGLRMVQQCLAIGAERTRVNSSMY
jgi:hypothetical protein